MAADEVRRKRRRHFSTSTPNSSSTASGATVIELTESSPETETKDTNTMAVPDDEAFARTLQAQLDAEQDYELIYQPVASSSKKGGRTPQPAPGSSTLDDEVLARQLQKQWNDEGSSNAYQTSLPASRPLIDSHSPFLSPGTTKLATPDFSSESPLRSQDVERSLHAFYHSIKQSKCQKCLKPMFKHEKDILKQFDIYVDESSGTDWGPVCVACNYSSGADSDRLSMMWVLLCGFDERSKHNKRDKKKRKKEPTKNSISTSGTGYGGPSGPYYGKHSFKTGGVPKAVSTSHHGDQVSMPGDPPYLAQQLGPMPKPHGAKAQSLDQTEEKQREALAHNPDEIDLEEDDSMTVRVFDCLTRLLPSFEKQSTFDLDPPAEQLQCMLLGSSVLERAADLLRNNDVEEVNTQAKLYLSLVRFLRAMAQHTSTSVLVLRERVLRSPGVSILKVSLSKVKLVGTAEHDTTQPLVKTMRELSIQCKTMMRNPEADECLMQAFHAIVELHDFLTMNAGESTPTLADKNAWQKDLAVSEVPEEVIIAKHSLVYKEAVADSMHRGRMTRIMQEVARLQANLPAGIFVRYGSSRPDVMKVMIVGPKGTPYENGLFEFDLLCGAKFPNEPPKMEFRTTAGGIVHFNPNLYASGKVCLSLLGTWAGESWDPKQSTLLQVLVSIQAMIFCDNPWNNEPGRENVPNGDMQSKAYNRTLYPHTVQTAMLDWLDRRRYKQAGKITRGDGLGQDFYAASRSRYCEKLGEINGSEDMWDEIVKRHFEANADDIIATVTKWVADRPPPPATVAQRTVHGMYMPPPHIPSAPVPGLSGVPWIMAANGLIYGHPVNPLPVPTQPSSAAHVPSVPFGSTTCPTTAQPQTQEDSVMNRKAPELVGVDLATKLRNAVRKLRGPARQFGSPFAHVSSSW